LLSGEGMSEVYSTVIASEAKIQSLHAEEWNLRRFAPLHKRCAFVAGNDGESNYNFAFSRHNAPE
jgi:hypothetical protein